VEDGDYGTRPNVKRGTDLVPTGGRFVNDNTYRYTWKYTPPTGKERTLTLEYAFANGRWGKPYSEDTVTAPAAATARPPAG
jgi:hypothetical protein